MFAPSQQPKLAFGLVSPLARFRWNTRTRKSLYVAIAMFCSTAAKLHNNKTRCGKFLEVKAGNFPFTPKSYCTSENSSTMYHVRFHFVARGRQRCFMMRYILLPSAALNFNAFTRRCNYTASTNRSRILQRNISKSTTDRDIYRAS